MLDRLRNLTGKQIAIAQIVTALFWAALIIITDEVNLMLIGWMVTSFIPLNMLAARAKRTEKGAV